MTRSELRAIARYVYRPGCSMNSRRQVRFLVGWRDAIDLDSFIAASAGMKTSEWRSLNAHIDEWLDFPDRKIDKKKAHGWDSSQFGGKRVSCWVFKGGKFRLVGFLCHPESGMPRLEAFVPTDLTAKHKWEADTTLLDRAVRVQRVTAGCHWTED